MRVESTGRPFESAEPYQREESDECAVDVSVIIPVYHAEHTVARAIDSILRQHFDAFEIIAVDDGSTDRSLDILRAYSGKIKVHRQRNRGPAAARNAGAQLAVSKYLAFLDADDEWLPEKLRACVDALDASPDAVLAYSDMGDPNGRSFSPMTGSPTLEFLLTQPFGLSPSATVVRRQAFETCGGYSEAFGSHDLGEDTFMALRLRELGRFVHIPQPLVVYHGSSPSKEVSKFFRGHRTFTRLAKERYGSQSKAARKHVRRYYCCLLLRAALDELRKGSRPSGLLGELVRVATADPGFVLYRVLSKVKRSAGRRIGEGARTRLLRSRLKGVPKRAVFSVLVRVRVVMAWPFKRRRARIQWLIEASGRRSPIYDVSGLSEPSKRFYIYLASRTLRWNLLHLRTTTIAHAAGLSQKNAHEAIRELELRGLLAHRRNRTLHRGGAHSYRVKRV